MPTIAKQVDMLNSIILAVLFIYFALENNCRFGLLVLFCLLIGWFLKVECQVPSANYRKCEMP